MDVVYDFIVVLYLLGMVVIVGGYLVMLCELYVNFV